MNIFFTSFESVATLIGVGVLGFWIVRRGLFPGDVLKFLNPLAIDVALPSLVFYNIIMNFSPEATPGWWQLPIWWVFFTAILIALTHLTGILSKKSTRPEFKISLLYQNGIFLPLVVIGGMFGDNSHLLVYLFLFTLLFPGFVFSTYHFFYGKKEGIDWKKVLNPVLIASLLAIFIRYFNMQGFVPGFIISCVKLVGGMAIPTIMIIIGGNIYVDFQKKGPLYTGEVIKFLLLKNIIFPLIFLGLLIFIRPHYEIALIILLQSAVPPITAAPVVVEREGGNKNIANQFVLASFIFSLFSISLMLMLFSRFFTP